MAGQLTHTENIRCQFKELTFTTSPDYSTNEWATIQFPYDFKDKPLEVVISQINKTDINQPIYDPVSVNWVWNNGNIEIRWIAGLEDETTYTVRFKVI